MKLSSRAQNIQASPIRKLAPFAIQAKAEGVEIFHLNIGQPDIPTAPVIMNTFRKYNEQVLPYGPSQGIPEYRQALKDYYNRNDIAVELDDIIVTTAGSEAIVFAMSAVCNHGEEVLIPEPFYTNYSLR